MEEIKIMEKNTQYTLKDLNDELEDLGVFCEVHRRQYKEEIEDLKREKKRSMRDLMIFQKEAEEETVELKDHLRELYERTEIYGKLILDRIDKATSVKPGACSPSNDEPENEKQSEDDEKESRRSRSPSSSESSEPSVPSRAETSPSPERSRSRSNSSRGSSKERKRSRSNSSKRSSKERQRSRSRSSTTRKSRVLLREEEGRDPPNDDGGHHSGSSSLLALIERDVTLNASSAMAATSPTNIVLCSTIIETAVWAAFYLLNCFLALLVVWSSIGCQCNPFERPKTAGEQVKFIEAYYQDPTVVRCNLGQICLIPLSTVNRNSTEPIVYPVNITFVTGEKMKWSFSENNIFVLPLTTGMSSQKINHFDVRKEPVEFSYEVSVLEEHPHNHQFEITLNQPNLTIFNNHQENFIDFIKTLARALDISIIRLTVDKIFPREDKMVFVVHDNRVPVFWCDMDSINAVKYKMISWFGGLKNDFTTCIGGQFEIDTVELQKIGICYKSFTSYLKHIGLGILIFLGFIVLMVSVGLIFRHI